MPNSISPLFMFKLIVETQNTIKNKNSCYQRGQISLFSDASNGLLAGMEKSEAFEKYPGKYRRKLAWRETWPGGESPEEFFCRIKDAWYNFKKQVGKRNTLLVTHGGVINVILCLENGIVYTNKETHFQIQDAGIVEVDL